jgi:hypothetical protein
VQVGLARATRLCQCRSAVITTRGTELPMQVDGEPWMQPPAVMAVDLKVGGHGARLGGMWAGNSERAQGQNAVSLPQPQHEPCLLLSAGLCLLLCQDVSLYRSVGFTSLSPRAATG